MTAAAISGEPWSSTATGIATALYIGRPIAALHYRSATLRRSVSKKPFAAIARSLLMRASRMWALCVIYEDVPIDQPSRPCDCEVDA